MGESKESESVWKKKKMDPYENLKCEKIFISFKSDNRLDLNPSFKI